MSMKEWLVENGLAYRDFAAIMGQSPSSICKKVNGETAWQQKDCCFFMTTMVFLLISYWVSPLFPIRRRCLSDKRMPGLDLVHRNRAYATHPMFNDSPVAKLLNRSHCLLDYGGCTNV